MKPIKSDVKNDLTIEIFADENPECSRDWDNLGTMACFHKKYSLGDKDHGLKTPEECMKFVGRWDVISLPIYMYDHSGLALSTDPARFQTFDPQGWDWGKLGYIFVTKEKVLKEYGKRITKAIEEKVFEQLNCEVETYGQYLAGEVYGYTIKNEAGEVLDSCWGFYGLDYCFLEAEDCRNHMIDSAEKVS